MHVLLWVMNVSGEDEAVGDACVPQEQVSDTADDVFESLVTSNFTSLLCLPCIYLGSGTCIRRIAAMLVPFLWGVIGNYLCCCFIWQIVFSEAWWIGTKEENPQELKLDFPKEFQNVRVLSIHICYFLFLNFRFFYDATVPLISCASSFQTGRMGLLQILILKVEQVLPVMKLLPSINRQRKPPQDPFPLRLNLTLILPRIQTLRTRITHKALVKHLQLGSLLELLGKP